MSQSANLSDIPCPILLDQFVNKQDVLKFSGIRSQKQLSINECSNCLIIKYDCDDEQIDKGDEVDGDIEEDRDVEGAIEGNIEGDDNDEGDNEDDEGDGSKKPQSYKKIFKDTNSDIIKTTGYSRKQLEKMNILEIRKQFKRKTELYNYILKVRRRSKNCKYSVKSRLSKKNKE